MPVSIRKLLMKEVLSKTLVIFLLFLVFVPSIRAQEELMPEETTEFDFLEEIEFQSTKFEQIERPHHPIDSLELRTLRLNKDKLDAEVPSNRNWWYLLRKGKLNLNDTTVEYPKFVKFCVDVYKWGDRFFNTFDPEYVEGTGYRWKARLVNENWTDSYALRFKETDVNMRMLSSLNVNIGAYIQYMAVSVGYSLDMNTIFGGRKTDHTRFDTSFSCALFNAELYYYHNSGTRIRQFMGFNNNRLIDSDFPGVTANNLGFNLYYFFNNKKYSQGAAYSFAKYQRKSAGSWMAGFAYSNLDISMDFNSLSPELKPLYTFPSDILRCHYHSYCIIGGYGYNWVFHPKWLFNVTVMPSIGVNHCYEDSSEGSGTLLSLNIHGRTSVTFNHRSMFASFIGKITGNWYTSKSTSLFNAIEYFSFNVGFRF